MFSFLQLNVFKGCNLSFLLQGGMMPGGMMAGGGEQAQKQAEQRERAEEMKNMILGQCLEQGARTRCKSSIHIFL